ncbi:MAG TPA: tRNA (adenosine(37)-N6)-threonylcarbamoyltransferase complex dimerization subunit type 1 TsaB [Acidimicrobiales bacterium]|nr:tRNA (adenosine(37)-N6)-threonylcarbamoyltransferase complex dimerization subunit type 1 TsaB [Acidimicrobiales bacterium]
MTVLAIETATIEVGAALVGADGPLAESRAPSRRRHAEMLAPAIESVVAAAGVALAAVDAVAVDVGPGLFTGLRVGIVAAKALGFALGIPLVAVRSTEVLRRGADATGRGREGVVVPVVDMRRGEFAWELPGGILGLGPASELGGRLAGLAGEVLVVGDGVSAVQSVLVAARRGLPLRFGDASLAAPSVAVLGAIGVERLAAGATTDAVSIEPCYLRAADATANFATRDLASPGGTG